jgi:hypothetical protein
MSQRDLPAVRVQVEQLQRTQRMFKGVVARG